MARSTLIPLAALLPLLLYGASCGPSQGETPEPTPTLGDGLNAFDDADGDGSLVGDDCDDGDASVHPGADELCNGADEDCDGVVDEGFDKDGDSHLDAAACAAQGGDDCDDSNPFVGPDATETCDGEDDDCDEAVDEDPEGGDTWFADADGDGLGDSQTLQRVCAGADGPEGYVDNSVDCDDTDAGVGRPIRWYLDEDGDSFGVDETEVASCTSPGEGYVDAGGDCDDADASRSPIASESCDGVDNDCDGEVDDGVQTAFYLDEDGDGYGTDDSEVYACAAPTEQYTQVHGDCDDTRSIVNPGQTDFCDELDNDCDGATDEPDNQSIPYWYADFDGDGYGDPDNRVRSCDAPSEHVDNGDDCDDTSNAIHPDATDVCSDGIDQDCSGSDTLCQ